MNKQTMNRLRLVFLLAPIVLWPLAAAADPLDQWHWRNPLPTANRVNAMIYANGRFMAVDSGGEILTSSNGLDWAIRDCGYSCGLEGIAFGNGLYVAVGSQEVYSPGEADGYPFVLTSPDGVTWTSQSVGVSAPGSLLSVCFGSGTFVAVGAGGMPSIWSSPDGTNWNAQGPAGLAHDLGLEYLDAVAYANGEFVAVGPASDAFRSFEPILTSPDGANWTSNQVPWMGQLYGVDVLNGAFAVTGMEEAIDRAGLFFSTDGSTWTNQSFTTTTGGFSSLHSACYGAGTYVAAGYTSQGGIIFSSTNGRVWAVTDLDPDSFGGFLTTAYGNGAFVVGGGGMLTSTNGSNWVKLGSGVTSSLFGIVYDLGQFVAAGSGGITLYSTDGLSWTAVPSGVTNDLCGIASGDGGLVAVGQAGMILTSSNAVNWTAHAAGLTTNAVKDICHGNGMFAAVTDGGEILASTNGTQWAIQSSGVAADLEGIAFGQGTFVAVGASGSGPMALASRDGTNWVSSVPGPVTLAGVAYGNGAFLAFSSGYIMTSDDGLNWSTLHTPSDGGIPLNRVCYAHGMFVGLGGSTGLATSTNGLDWTARNPPTQFNLYGVAYGNNTFMVVGDLGIVLQSDPLPVLALGLRAGGRQVGGFLLNVTGPAGQSWEIQASTNLVDWVWLTQFPSTGTTMRVIDSRMPNYSRRFYRGQWW